MYSDVAPDDVKYKQNQQGRQGELLDRMTREWINDEYNP